MIRTANKPKTCLARGIILAVALVLSASTPKAETNSTNKIHNIKIQEQKGKTVVYVEGSKRPSFTAFKLSSPKRLVIDLADSQVRGVPSVMEKTTDLIEGVAVSQYSVKGVPVSRVMINFKKDVAYRVRVKGNKLVASLSGAPGDTIASASKKGRGAAASADQKALMAELETLRNANSRHQAEAERAKKTAQKALSELKSAQREADDAKKTARLAQSKLRATLEEAEATKRASKRAQADLASYQKQSRRRQDKDTLDRLKAEVEKLRRTAKVADAKIKTTKGEAAMARAEAARKQKALAALETELARSKSNLKANQVAASRAEKQAKEAQAKMQRYASEAKSAKAQAKEVKSKLTALQKEAERARAAAEKAKVDLASLQKQLKATRLDVSQATNEREARHAANLRTHEKKLTEAESALRKYQEKAKEADVVAKREKAIREKLEQELQSMIRERDRALTEKEKTEAAKRSAEASARRLKRELAKYETRFKSAESRAEEALKEQVAASKAYQKAATSEREKLLAVLREKERETVQAKKKAAELKDDFKRAKHALGKMENELQASRGSRGNSAAELQRVRAKLERERKLANERYLEAKSAAAAALKRAEQAKSSQDQAQAAIARIRKEADDFKTKAEAEAQLRVAEAREQLRASEEKADAARDKLNAAQNQIADYMKNAEAADARAKNLAAELAKAQQKITRQEKKIAALEVSKVSADEATRHSTADVGSNGDRPMTMEEKRLARYAELQGKGKAPGRSPKTKTAAKRSKNESKTVTSPSIRNIEFADEGDLQQVIVHTTSPLEYSLATDDAGNANITFENARLAAMLERTLDVTDFEGVIGSVSSYQDGGNVQVRVDVDKMAKNTVERQDNKLVFSFARQSDKVQKRASGPLGASSRTVAREEASTYYYPFERTAAYSSGKGKSKKKRYTGRHIDLDFKDADIHNILRLLSDVGHVNIITADDVTGTVTIRMRDVAWDHALDIILQAKQLGMVREGNLIRVAPLAVLEKEREMEIARRQQQIALEPLETRLIPISYATASELMPRAQDLLSERGKLSTDNRTNVIIARDTKDVLNQIEALIRNLDTQTPQVLIESRIVEATSMYAREIGIQWGGDFSASSATGNPTGLIFPNTIGLAGGATDSQTPTAGLTPVANGQPNPNFGVNMPAPVGTNSGGALGITLGSISNNSNLSLRLSAMEETGTLRILSSPKILTLDNREAQIEQGTMIPYSQVSAQGVQTAFKEAKLNLTVTPHVTADGSVLLSLTVMRDEPDFNNTGARGDPTILKRQAKTELLVSDGHTAVIGGIFTRNAGTSFKKVPFFADIPIIGWLFKKKSDSDRRSEMLIFITPRIVNRAESIGR